MIKSSINLIIGSSNFVKNYFMSFKEIFDVPKNHQLIINLPQDFPSKKKVVVTVEEIPLSKKEKMKRMKRAASDPLFIQDMSEVNNDFEGISDENL